MATSEVQADTLEYFEKEVRPILAEHCYSCHGAEKQKASLRLDHVSFLLKGGDSGPALVPGKVDESRLAIAVGYGNVDLQMPPKYKLPDEQIEVLRKWVADGAVWPDEPVPTGAGETPEAFDVQALADKHWAWQSIKESEPPTVKSEAWPRNDIDRFILAKLEEKGFDPAQEADRNTLIRRLSFDLTGLPPTPEMVERFISDERPDAYERLVDELLASPDYGERWGRHWLDVTRFAETFGHEQDYPIEHAWRYRDYVIRAFNADLPYDEMLREHVAGDLLENPRINVETGLNESLAATGFWYMHQATHAPVDVRQDQADRIDNQIDVFSKGFLGMTVSCARCHDHKFDAISMADYYALAGFLRSSRQLHAYEDGSGAIAAGKEKIAKAARRVELAIRESFEQREQSSASIVPYLMATAEAARSDESLEDIAIRSGLNPERLKVWNEIFKGELVKNTGHPLNLWAQALAAQKVDTEWFQSQRQRLSSVASYTGAYTGSIVYEAFDTPTSFARWSRYGTAFDEHPTSTSAWMEDNGNLELVARGQVHSGLVDARLQGTLRSPDFTIEHDGIYVRASGTGGEIRLIIEGYELREFNGILFESTLVAVKEGAEPRWYPMVAGLAKFKGRRAFIEIVDNGDGWIAVDEIRFSDSGPGDSSPSTVSARVLNSDMPESMLGLATSYAFAASNAMSDWLEGKADAGQLELINLLARTNIANPVSGNRQYAKAVKIKDRIASELPWPERVLAMVEGTPTDEILMLRGNHKTPGEPVGRRFLEALGGLQEEPIREGSGRLDLAEDLLREDNPLTSRVMANRIWHHFMGRGLVPTVDNFGVLGQTPSHPELLDYLAISFRENGWSIKQLIRDIVTSKTYRMSSAAANPAAEEADPDNVFLHRMNRRRLEGEAIRDAILYVAGTLDPTRFGPSVPAYISPFVEGNRRPEKSGPADGDRRRSIYLEVRRNYLTPMLQAFDMPVPDSTQGRRNVSNVPAQALIMMNDPIVVDQAKAWAASMIAAYPELEGRVNAMYEAALSRSPTEAEVKRIADFVTSQAGLYEVSPEDAAQDERVWTDVCHVLFTLKEFIFVA